MYKYISTHADMLMCMCMYSAGTRVYLGCIRYSDTNVYRSLTHLHANTPNAGRASCCDDRTL